MFHQDSVCMQWPDRSEPIILCTHACLIYILEGKGRLEAPECTFIACLSIHHSQISVTFGPQLRLRDRQIRFEILFVCLPREVILLTGNQVLIAHLGSCVSAVWFVANECPGGQADVRWHWLVNKWSHKWGWGNVFPFTKWFYKLCELLWTWMYEESPWVRIPWCTLYAYQCPSSLSPVIVSPQRTHQAENVFTAGKPRRSKGMKQK